MMDALRNQNLRNLSIFVNKSPRWSPELNAYVLSFGGRVTMTSVKNFQLVNPNDQDTVLLQVHINYNCNYITLFILFLLSSYYYYYFIYLF